MTVSDLTIRADAVQSFLAREGWAGNNVLHTPITDGWDLKTITRLKKADGQSAILMVWAGSNIHLGTFLFVADTLRAAGFSAPEIYAADLDNEIILVEDFGDMHFNNAVAMGEDYRDLFFQAAGILKLFRHKFSRPIDKLPTYLGSRLHRAKEYILRFYLKGTEDQIKKYNNLWKDFEKDLPPCPETFLHGDYDFQNLMWLPGRDNHLRVGLIDFGSAMWAQAPYDLVNLLETVRSDIPEDLRAELKAFYCEGMTEEEQKHFNIWYDVMAFQFHSRVIGQIEDLDRDDLRIYTPRVRNYIRAHLQKEIFKDFRLWFEAQGFDV